MQKVYLLLILCFSVGDVLAQRYSLILAQQVKKVADVHQKLVAYEDFGPKFTGSPALNLVNNWLTTYYQDLGYRVIQDSFKARNQWASNIIIEKNGADTSTWVIVGAHYDSVHESYGANDNGSGVVATMEIARLIAEIPTQYSIRIINFSAEEQGLLGSEHYVANTLNPDEKIDVMLNLDQLGGTRHQDNSKITCERDEGNRVSTNDEMSFKKTDTLAQIFRDYTALKPVFGPAFSTDYMPFEKKGYVITGLYQESDYRFFSHTLSDRVFNMDTDATFQVIQGALAATLYFAKPLNKVPVDHAFSILPNPVKDSFRLWVDGHDDISYSIYNAVGQKIMSGKSLIGAQIDTPPVANGLYTIRIYSSKEFYISSTKLIIAR